MKKISKKSIFYATLIIICGIVVAATSWRISKLHNERLIYAMESKIQYYAKRCYLENNCHDTITLKDLYDKKYLNEVVHPVTKEVIDEQTTIEYQNQQIIIHWSQVNA